MSATKLLSSLVSGYLARKARSITSEEKSLTVALQRYFESTFIRCTQIKTLLSEETVPLLSCHVEQTFRVGNKDAVDHYALVDEIKSGKSFIIAGTGGSGKSIFNKYLWISLLENTEGRIPIYFELKDVNQSKSSEPNVLDLIFYGSVDTKSNLSKDEFATAVKNGEVMLILDAFDEINNDRRDHVEQQIIALAQNNPKSRVVVASRPDERLSGWPRFTVAQIQPLTKPAVIDLIKRAEFNDKYKSDMLKRLRKGDLFATHGTFLTNPLLCYIMVVTIANESKDRDDAVPSSMSRHLKRCSFVTIYGRAVMFDRCIAAWTRTNIKRLHFSLSEAT